MAPTRATTQKKVKEILASRPNWWLKRSPHWRGPPHDIYYLMAPTRATTQKKVKKSWPVDLIGG
jgi:hypothetical protein